jgi:hypothetical protein
MRIIRSVRDAVRGVTIQKQPEAGIGQMRCMKCQGICTATRLPGGTSAMKCGSCQAIYNVTALDGPKPPPPGAVPKRAPAR